MGRLAAAAPLPVKRVGWESQRLWSWWRSPASRIARAYTRRYGLTVRGGPFTGMSVPRFALPRAKHLVTLLLGAYERELHAAVADVVARRPSLVVDIGAADGYYAVGFARALPDSRVLAYETDPWPARVCRSLAEENGVADRLELRGECRPGDLAELPDDGSLFVLCDVEGAEAQLMDPSAAPALARAAAIVELHEWASPGVTELVTGRFAATHEIDLVHPQPRYMSEYPALMELDGVTFEDRELGINEIRHSPCAWALLTPKRPR